MSDMKQTTETVETNAVQEESVGVELTSKAIPLTAFGINSQGAVPGFEPGHALQEHVPHLDEAHKFPQDALRDTIMWLNNADGDGIYFHGPTGCGKTSLIVQVAARLNWPVRRTNGTARLELADLVGDMGLETGESGAPETRFHYGPLALAMKEGSIFILDEIDLIDPSVVAALNPVLEGDALVLDRNGGEVIHPHPNFRFVATGNTAGLGDDTGNYVGTSQQNLATMDRFWVIEMGYMAPEDEKEILMAKFGHLPNVQEAVVDRMIQLANRVREAFVEGTLSATFSTRTLIRWASTFDLCKESGVPGCPLDYSLRRSLSGRLPKHEQEAVHDMKRSIFPEED